MMAKTKPHKADTATPVATRRSPVQKIVEKEKVGVIDFFCGCGGASRGFQLANTTTVKFEVIAGVDFDEASCRTFESSIGAKAIKLGRAIFFL